MLSREEVIKIAKLSKLKFNDDEIENFRNDLNKIFEYVEMINELDVENVEPLFNVMEVTHKLREDNVSNTLNKEEFLNNSNIKDSDFIVVPKIIE